MSDIKYCPKCRELNSGHWMQSPATGKLVCRHCGAELEEVPEVRGC